jgi:ABC-2 type transport system permease protein
MKAYISMFNIRFSNNLQYKIAAWAGIATQFAWGGMYILLYSAIYKYSPVEKPMELSQLTSYIWLGQAFLALVMPWGRDSGLFEMIMDGNVAYELVRPINLYPMWYSRLLSRRLASAALRFLPILLVSGFLIPAPYGLDAPVSLTAFALFVISMTLGMIIAVAFTMIVTISVFSTLSPAGSFTLFALFADLLSGMLIPLPLMPLVVQKVIKVLPFWLTWDFPFRIYTGHIPVTEAFSGFVLQIVWSGILILIGLLWLFKVRRKLIIQGG